MRRNETIGIIVFIALLAAGFVIFDLCGILELSGKIDTAQVIEIIILFALVLATFIYAKRTAEIADATKEQRYAENLPLLVPTITPVYQCEISYEAVASGVGMKVMWCNVGKGVAINPLFSFWRVPRRFSFGGAPISSEGASLFPPRESGTLEVGSKKEVDYSQIPSDEELNAISDTYHPRLVAEYQDIYERSITTVQEFRIDKESKRAFVGELILSKIDGR